MGPCDMDLLASCLMNNSLVLQLEAGPGSRRGGCIQSGLVSSKGLCQPTMVPNLSISGPSEEAASQSSVNHASMTHSAMVTWSY